MKAPERAMQIWSVLALAATNRQILTYDLLSDLVGVPNQGLGQLLEPIQSYCLQHDLPPLTILVVGKDTGLPGVGFIAASEIPAAQQMVFGHDWCSQGCPSAKAFDEAVKRRKSQDLQSAASGGRR